jgi:K+-transporting ATPase ATPase C chain
MKQNLKIAILFTIVTTVLLGIIYPLVVTGLSQVLFHDKANGQLISRNGEVIGSHIIGQTFAAPGYLHSRPSAAGNGYDAANSGGTNFGPTNQKLIDRVKADTERWLESCADNAARTVPVASTTSGTDVFCTCITATP